ncbi:Serine protease [Phytophthora megakarya]|uniref:Serine protease n=1 Tax=Phytophthora megakarya TaxID=4795 RepID=A0A225WK28_9STRA|nr:Serine protease [Phytophthora megakarya]
MGVFRRKKPERKDEEKVEMDIPPPLLTVLKSVQQMDRKPPVTLTLIAIMYFLHVQVTRTPLLLQFALCPGKVVKNKEIGAVFMAPFIHVEDLHLYQSMYVKICLVVICRINGGARLSFLWKGYKLEGRLGSIGFSVLLVYLIVFSQALIVYGAHLISWGAVQECFTGLSGVLTAMKVILNVNSPTFTKLYNFKVPTKYAAWLELFITYLLVPKLPLLAQAAGLIAGVPTGT